MFFDALEEIREIASWVGTSIFVVPKGTEVEIPGAIRLQPEEKATITIDQVREVMRLLSVRQAEHQFVVINPADKMGEEAMNASLKSLEEPGNHVHFVLVTDELTKLLPTIRSRAVIYILRRRGVIDEPVVADEATKLLAKKLIAAKPNELLGLAEELTRKKDGVRGRVLTILGVAIEMAYKSYFKTGKMAFLTKVSKLVAAYEAISQNGQVKLQIVANLV